MSVGRGHFTAANILAVIAVFVALGGGAYAAVTANSVGTKQLKKNAVVSVKVKNGSLLRRDFRAGQLRRGRRGPLGNRGPTGPTGSAGPSGGPFAISAESAAAQVLVSTNTNFQAVVETPDFTSQGTDRVVVTASADLTGDDVDVGECVVSIVTAANSSNSIAYRTDFNETFSPNDAVITVNYADTVPAGTHHAILGCRAAAGTVTKVLAGINVYVLGA